MIYEKNNMKLISDFEIRIIRQDENQDIDIYIDIDGLTVNTHTDHNIGPIISRLQFPGVKAILIRFNSTEDRTATIVMLKNIDIHSQSANFEIDYRHHQLRIERAQFNADLIIEKKP